MEEEHRTKTIKTPMLYGWTWAIIAMSVLIGIGIIAFGDDWRDAWVVVFGFIIAAAWEWYNRKLHGR